MPRPRLFTDEQEDAMLAQFRAELGAHGAMATLAWTHNVTQTGMTAIIRRAEKRAALCGELEVSRETSGSTEHAP
jgi:hypothetical protein